jgi:hypothetical protein
VSTREIEEFAELFDVGPVTYPAYDATSVASRGWLEGAPAELRSAIGSTLRDNPVGSPANKCQCTCAECQVGNCDNCSNDDCDEPGCDHTPDDDGDERARLLAEAQMHERSRLAAI